MFEFREMVQIMYAGNVFCSTVSNDRQRQKPAPLISVFHFTPECPIVNYFHALCCRKCFLRVVPRYFSVLSIEI